MTTTKLIPILTFGCSLLTAQGMLSEAFAQAAQRQPTGAAVAYTTEAVATVESVDQQTRQVVLRGAGGKLFEVQASPAVEHLDRVKPGDRVVVRYVEALAASLAKPGQGAGGTVTEQAGISRHAPEGGKPTATVGSQVRSIVTIDAVDRATHTVTFSGPGNVARTVAVRDPEAQRFVDTLKVGDRVDLVYTESLAVAVEPMSR